MSKPFSKSRTCSFNPSWKIPQMHHVDVSENSGTPKSSILIGFSIIDHPFWGTPIFGNTHVCIFLPKGLPMATFNKGKGLGTGHSRPMEHLGGGFPKIGVFPPKWMIYNGKPYYNGWVGGITIFGNIQLVVEPSHLKNMTRQIRNHFPRVVRGVENNGNHLENVWSFTTYGLYPRTNS